MTDKMGNEFAVLAQQLGTQHASSLQDFTSVKKLPAGAILIQDQAAIDSLYLVLEGVLSVSLEGDGRSLLLGRLGPGKWVGDVSLLSGETTASSTVSAEQPTTVLELKHEAFRKLTSEHPELAYSLLKVLIATLAERIRATDESVKKSPDGRLSLKGSEKITQSPSRDKNWLKGMLQKLSGVEAA